MGCSNSKAKKPKVPVTNPYAKIHKQREKDVDEVAKVPSLEDITIPDVLKSSAEEFQIGSYLQEGGMGKGAPTLSVPTLTCPLTALQLITVLNSFTVTPTLLVDTPPLLLVPTFALHHDALYLFHLFSPFLPYYSVFCCSNL